MMRRKLLMCLFLLAGGISALGQGHDQLILQDDDFEWPERQGFVFGMSIGAYFANKQSAAFYNGEALYELGDNLATIYNIEDRLFLNDQTYQQVTNLIEAQDFSIPFDSYPQAMRYNPGVLIGFRAGYRLNNENSFFLDLNYATLKAADKFTLVTNLLPDPSQGTQDIRLYNIIGEEDRLNIHLGYRAGIVVNEDMNWYIEGGASMLAIRLQENFLEIEGTTFDLWIAPFGPNNISGPQSNLTGTGYGFYGGTGVEVFFDERFEIDLGMRLSRDKVVMGSFSDNLINTSVFLSFTL